MNNKIYTPDELQELLTVMFYEELSKQAVKIAEERREFRNDILTRRQEYMNVAPTKLKQAISILDEMLEQNEEPTIEKQKELFARTHEVYGSHTSLHFSLQGRINKNYDDKTACFAFFDSLTNSDGLLELEKAKDKISYVKSKIELTHVSISKGYDNSVVLYGNFDKEHAHSREYAVSIDFIS